MANKTDNSPTADDGAESAPKFEDALAELRQIVGELEDGRLGLQESLQRFERGMNLLRTCYRTLEDAEQKIEVLTGWDRDGNPKTEPLDASATAGSEAKSNASANNAQETNDDSQQTDSGETLF